MKISLVTVWDGLCRPVLSATAILGIVAAGVQAARSQGAMQIFVGPNVRISADSEKSHFEPSISSTGDGTIIASTNLMGGDDNAWISKAYVSRDNGNTWYSLWFTDLLQTDHIGEQQSGDGITAAGANGRIFLGALLRAPEKFHELITYIWSSDDKGHSWSAHKRLEIADHERFLVDTARHWVIMSGKGEASKPDSMVVYVSTDNGTTFGKPIVYARLTGIAYDPSELPNGDVFLPFLNEDMKKKESYLVGVTLNPRTRSVTKVFPLQGLAIDKFDKASTREYYARAAAGAFGETAQPTFVYNGKMMYLVDGSSVHGISRLFIAESHDGGHTWVKRHPVAPNVGTGFDQFAASAAFNQAGTLGIVWAQMDGKTTYHERFTASFDAGKTFLPSRVITTNDSMPFNDENMGGEAVGYGGSFFATSGFITRPPGGDYFGMTTDSDGAFHPVWIDTRDGVGAQLYTARLLVAETVPACQPVGDVVDLTKSVGLVFDPIIAHASQRIIEYPIRLHNTGNSAITGPLVYTLTKVQGGQLKEQKSRVVLGGTSNGKSGVGATLDFTTALGDFNSLPPGGVTNPRMLSAHIANPLSVEASMDGKVTGRRCAP